MRSSTSFIRYVAIGIGNTALDFAIYTVLTRTSTFWRERYVMANALSFLVVVTWSFIWNKYWAFQERHQQFVVQYGKFFVSTFTGAMLSQGAFFVLIDVLAVYDLIAKIIVTPLVIYWNYSVYRYWVFY